MSTTTEINGHLKMSKRITGVVSDKVKEPPDADNINYKHRTSDIQHIYPQLYTQSLNFPDAVIAGVNACEQT